MTLQPVPAGHAPLLAALDKSRPFSAHWSVQDWQAELAQAASAVWGAYVDGKLVGFVSMRGAAGMYEITNLAVAAGSCRQGIGRQLVQRALQGLSGHITLEVSVQNVPAIGLYEQAGFTRQGVRKQFYADGSDALIMGIVQ